MPSTSFRFSRFPLTFLSFVLYFVFSVPSPHLRRPWLPWLGLCHREAAAEADDAEPEEVEKGSTFKPTKLSTAIEEGHEDDEEEGEDDADRFSEDDEAPVSHSDGRLLRVYTHHACLSATDCIDSDGV